MANPKTKASKKSETRAVPDDVTHLLELLINEIQSPIDTQHLLTRLPSTTHCTAELRDFLKAKDRAQRREAFIKTEALWFRKYGWFMARVVLLFAILVIAYTISSRNKNVDFVTFVVLGAAFYYGLLVTLSNWRYREKNRKRQAQLDAEARKYQREIIGIAASLMQQFKIDASRFTIAKPKTEAGLENRDGKFIIPLSLE